MQLGAFALSLTVKELAMSRAFYAKLGFEPIGGEENPGWLIVPNDQATIGLFQGMFSENILTINPGRDAHGNLLSTSFTDVRELQRRVRASEIDIRKEADETTSGPAAFVIEDLDGNPILIDQHVWAFQRSLFSEHRAPETRTAKEALHGTVRHRRVSSEARTRG